MSNYLTDPAIPLGRVDQADITKLDHYMGEGIFNALCRKQIDGGLSIVKVERASGGIHVPQGDAIPTSIISPFTSICDSWLLPEEEIDVTYQRSLVLPGTIQRADKNRSAWHFDGFSRALRAVSFSNILSTVVVFE